eukprot:CAMPEP_0206471074 /NCGR_PEP_ID=MMETSP0324_2-20121206/31330_1 /ASSEMBLY_ACC=CAM_ASM_000836 /TAXON_ID=2866 /ORGANISM="Crypthecodinium cohnii, Strain Seligo" /LENGTH=117 /DNA_ID=CAMNT_0053945297 /DNA_START=153 /DNA_END=503 /DNA_ORIENTATION=+
MAGTLDSPGARSADVTSRSEQTKQLLPSLLVDGRSKEETEQGTNYEQTSTIVATMSHGSKSSKNKQGNSSTNNTNSNRSTAAVHSLCVSPQSSRPIPSPAPAPKFGNINNNNNNNNN